MEYKKNTLKEANQKEKSDKNNIPSISKTNINGSSNSNLKNKKEQNAIDKKALKFFGSLRYCQNDTILLEELKKRNPIPRQQKGKYTQKPQTNEVEARLQKKLSCFIMSRIEKTRKRRKYTKRI